MKVYTKVVIDMETMEVIEEEAYEYEGPVALCGGSSGGSSGEVDYPTYAKEAHAQLMYGAGEDGYSAMEITTPMDDAVNTAISGNPYVDLVPYDPSTRITEMEDAVADLDSYITSIDAAGGEIETEVDNQLAAFDAGMRDINAVNSSAFAIGKQIVASKLPLVLLQQKLQAKHDLAHLSVESRRVMIVANKEFIDVDNEYQSKHVTWNLEMLQKGGNILASIQGVSTISKGEEPNQMRSVIGGAISGAAAGAMYGSVAGLPGALVGGVLGAAAGFLM